MKKTFLWGLLAIVSIAILGTSCSDDDDDDYTTAILGKWAIVSFSVNGQTIPYEHGECGKDYIEFKGNNTYQIVEIDDDCSLYVDEDGEYTLKGRDLTIASNYDDDPISVKIKISGTTLTFTTNAFDVDEDGKNDTMIQTYERIQ